MPPAPTGRTRRRVVVTIALVGSVAAVILGWKAYADRGREARMEAIDRYLVRRAPLHVSVRAGGTVESERKTVIECQVEALQFMNEGRSFAASGRPTILELVDEGVEVKKGDVLCRLDASDYEELVRQQEIKLQQARSDHYKAELDLKAAEQALTEYRDGLLPQNLEELSGQIVMTQAELQRQDDRLLWAQKMVKNGYYSEGQLVADKQRKLSAEVSLNNLRGQERLLRQISGPASLRGLEIQVNNARSLLSFQDLRLRRTEQQMDKFRLQVGYCTIRAPHDGTVVYAPQRGNAPIAVGGQAFQKMGLFYLPDLSQMEVRASLNESMVGRIKDKMAARVLVEGLPDYRLEGDVVGIDPLPKPPQDFVSMFSDVKSYIGRIRLRHSPKGLLPGMSAEVQIDTGMTENALVIPSGSIVADHGRDYCYVARRQGLERREIRVGQGTRDMLEVRSGLEEGEQVVLHPSQLDEGEVEEASSHTSELRPTPADGDGEARPGE